MSFRPIPVLIAALAAAAMAGCAAKLKPAMGGATAETALPPSASTGTGGEGGSELAGIRPGSPEDFAANVGDRVYFALDSHELSEDARSILDRQASWLNRYQTGIIAAGNADERGTREYNLALGARRAEAVRQYLMSRGVAANRLTTVSYGKERPLDTRSSEEGWAINRNTQSLISGDAR